MALSLIGAVFPSLGNPLASFNLFATDVVPIEKRDQLSHSVFILSVYGNAIGIESSSRIGAIHIEKLRHLIHQCRAESRALVKSASKLLET